MAMRYRAEEIEFLEQLAKNNPDINYDQANKIVNEHFNHQEKTQKQFYYMCAHRKIRFRPKSFIPQKEQDWIREHALSYSNYPDVIRDFNQKFGPHTDWQVINLIRKIHGSAKLKETTEWTPEMDEYLIKNYPNDPRSKDEFTADFNKIFHTNTTANALRSRANKKLNLKKANYKECLAYSTRRLHCVPIGSEYVDVKNGYTYVKVNDLYIPGKRTFPLNWVLKQRYVYEQAHGPIPKGYIVIFLDGDITNFELSNLALCTNKEKLHLQTLGWLGKGDATKVGLDVVRSEQALVDIGAIKRQKSDISRLQKFGQKKAKMLKI